MFTANPAPLNAMLLVQALIKHDLRTFHPAQFRQWAAQLEGADVCFTDLEGVVDDDGRGEYAEYTA